MLHFHSLHDAEKECAQSRHAPASGVRAEVSTLDMQQLLGVRSPSGCDAVHCLALAMSEARLPARWAAGMILLHAGHPGCL